MLDLRREIACREYIKTGIKSVAYERAGYNTTSPESTWAAASRLFRSVKVKERIEELQAEAIEAADLTKDRLLGQLLEVYKSAKADRNWNVASATIERLLKATNQWTDRVEDVTKRDDNAMLDNLEAQLIEAVGKDMANMLMDTFRQKLGQKIQTDERAH